MTTKSHWEDVYQNKLTNEVSWYQDNPLLSLQFIRHASPDSVASVIDIGCGVSSLIEKLLGAGYAELGVLDISAIALQQARERLADQSKKIRWYEADITAFSSPIKYDIWHDRAVFHFLTEQEQRLQYVQVMRETLKPSGSAIIATFAIGGPNKCSGLDIVQYDARKLSAELGGDFVLMEQASEIHMTPAGKEQAFQFFRYRINP
jgi:SAM-dependent methyltransferase